MSKLTVRKDRRGQGPRAERRSPRVVKHDPRGRSPVTTLGLTAHSVVAHAFLAAEAQSPKVAACA